MRPILKNNQRGFAMFIAVMILSLGTSFAFLAFQVSTTELTISRYSENEAAVRYLAESGVEKVLSWASNPLASPDPAFFADLPSNPCTHRPTDSEFVPDFPRTDHLSISPFTDFLSFLEDPDSGPFSELKEIGRIVDIQLYAPSHIDGICTVEVTAETRSGASAKERVNITANPMGTITAGIQGLGDAGNTLPVWAHWGDIRYTGQANLGENINIVPQRDTSILPNGDPYNPDSEGSNFDPIMTLRVEKEITAPTPDNGDSYLDRPNVTQNGGTTVSLDAIDFNRLRSFVKKHGAYYTVSEDGQHLLKNGLHILDEHDNHVDSFDTVFDGATEKQHLVWVENAGAPDLRINGGRFKGYFYFSGGIHINGDAPGRGVSAVSPEVPGGSDGSRINLSDINLEGIFVTKKTTRLEHRFSVYGAFYSLRGYTGDGTNALEVWYNSDFARGMYPGMRNTTPLAGTWRSVPLDE